MRRIPGNGGIAQRWRTKMIPTTFDHFHRVSTVPAVCYPLLVMNPWARALVITLQWILTSKTPPDQDFDCKTSSGFKGRLLMVVNYPRGKHKQVQKSPLGIESTIKLIKGPVRTLWRFPNFWNVYMTLRFNSHLWMRTNILSSKSLVSSHLWRLDTSHKYIHFHFHF